MSADDRERWDRIWRERAHAPAEEGAPAWLTELDPELPRAGRALDVACGAGRIARFWLERGLATLALDLSPEALRLARAACGAKLETRALDLESEPLPTGPFDAISVFHYLQRALFPQLVERLTPGGVLVCEIATVVNLERNEKPSRRFLLESGELSALCAPLEPVYEREAWCDDRHLARLVARRLV